MELTKQEVISITKLAKKQLGLENEINKLEVQLKKKQEELRKLSEDIIPSVMEEAGVKKFLMDNGFELEVKPDFAVNIKKENEDKAFSWLTKNKFGDIIKEEFKVKFGTGESALIKKFREILKKEKLRNWDEKRSIHHGTLKSFIKERIEEGKKIPPFDIFGIHQYSKTTIKPAKKQTKKKGSK